MIERQIDQRSEAPELVGDRAAAFDRAVVRAARWPFVPPWPLPDASGGIAGAASRSWVSGRYSNLEESVHAFDQMVADRYAGEAFVTRRTVVQRDASLARDSAPAIPPDASGNGHGSNGSNGHLAARATARSKAAARSTTSSGAPER